MYSLFHVVADNVLPEGEGDGTMEAVKSCVSGAATGALYKSGEKMLVFFCSCNLLKHCVFERVDTLKYQICHH